MIVHHCQWCVAKTPLAIASYLFLLLFTFLLKNKKLKVASGSDVFFTGVRTSQ
jgi:hypothetical protein